MAIPQTLNVEPSHKQVFETLRNFVEMVFSELGLTVAEIEKQSLPDLELSLATVRSAILRPDSFGTVQIKMTAETGMIMVNSKTESHLEMTILPILLERERLILKRIRALEEIHRLQDLKDVVEERHRIRPWNAKDIRDRLDKGIKAIQVRKLP